MGLLGLSYQKTWSKQKWLDQPNGAQLPLQYTMITTRENCYSTSIVLVLAEEKHFKKTNQVKAMIPYWCHLLNPLQSVLMNERRQVKEGFLALTIETCIVYVCLSKGKWARQKCFWTGYGSRCQAHRSRIHCFPCVPRQVHHPKDIQPTWHNCGKQCSQYGTASLWNAFNTL